MNENTLLSLITGGRYQTSADLPTFRETAHSFMDDLMMKQDAEMSEVLYPAGKNIFGQPTEPVTQEDLLSLVMGTLGPGQGARGALFGKAGRAEMKPLINKLTKDIDKMDRTI